MQRLATAIRAVIDYVVPTWNRVSAGWSIRKKLGVGCLGLLVSYGIVANALMAVGRAVLPPTATPTATATYTPRPTVTERPTRTPRPTSTPRPTNEPTEKPSVTPTRKPAARPPILTPRPLARPVATAAPVEPTAAIQPLISQPQPVEPPKEEKTCCKHCGSDSKPCGDSCISLRYQCHRGEGCACP